MNLVVPQQVKDRYAQVEAGVVAAVRGQIVALERLAGGNLSEARQKLDALPAQLVEFWPKLRARVQELLDIAPRTELALLGQQLVELQVSLAKISDERDQLRDDLQLLIEGRIGALEVELAAKAAATANASEQLDAADAIVEILDAGVVEEQPAAAPKQSNGKPKNNQRRR